MSKLAYDMSPAEQRAVFEAHKEKFGINFMPSEQSPGDAIFIRPEWKSNYNLAMDAQPQLVTTPSSGIPAFLSFFTDPDILRVMTAKKSAASIFSEKQKGTWEDTTLIFPVVEHTYEVSSYGDYNHNGTAGANTNFPERQNYLYQLEIEYGDLELARAGLAKIGWAAELKQAAIDGLNNFQNLSYFKGITGLQNYGILNSPDLYPAIAPGPKVNGGIAWMNGAVINASANEIFADIQGLVTQLVSQSSGLIEIDSEMVLALSPKSQVALTATNSFGVNVAFLLKENFPNLKVMTAIQYGALSAQNPQGSALGEIAQLWAPKALGQDSGFCSFSTKLQAGPIIRQTSSYIQKMFQGTHGFVLRQPFAMATLVGL